MSRFEVSLDCFTFRLYSCLVTETTSDAKVSRTQAERTAAMRGRLLDAAVAWRRRSEPRAAAGAEFDQPVGFGEQVEVVLDDDDGVAFIDEAVEEAVSRSGRSTAGRAGQRGGNKRRR